MLFRSSDVSVKQTVRDLPRKSISFTMKGHICYTFTYDNGILSPRPDESETYFFNLYRSVDSIVKIVCCEEEKQKINRRMRKLENILNKTYVERTTLK